MSRTLSTQLAHLRLCCSLVLVGLGCGIWGLCLLLPYLSDSSTYVSVYQILVLLTPLQTLLMCLLIRLPGFSFRFLIHSLLFTCLLQFLFFERCCLQNLSTSLSIFCCIILSTLQYTYASKRVQMFQREVMTAFHSFR